MLGQKLQRKQGRVAFVHKVELLVEFGAAYRDPRRAEQGEAARSARLRCDGATPACSDCSPSAAHGCPALAQARLFFASAAASLEIVPLQERASLAQGARS
jgi:hypothetical protein